MHCLKKHRPLPLKSNRTLPLVFPPLLWNEYGQADKVNINIVTEGNLYYTTWNI